MVSFAAPTRANMPPLPTSVAKTILTNKTSRRPITGTKRDSSHFDTEIESHKRSRVVTFKDAVDVHIMNDWTDKSYELVKEEVRVAIHRHLAPPDHRDDSQYSKILNILTQEAFSADAPPTQLLRRYVLALNSHIAQLGECEKLVMAVLDLSWLGRRADFVQTYAKLIVVLASTHSKFIAPVMERLVGHFEKLPASSGHLPAEVAVSRADMFDRLHACMQGLLHRIPSASIVLVRTIKHLFPNDMATVRSHLQYQRHLLRIAEAAPELKTEIIALIVQRLVAIDVQIQNDIEDLEDNAEEKLLQGPQDNTHANENDTDDSDIDSVSESELTTTEEEQRLRELRLKVAKMDRTQDLLFHHYDPSFRIETKPEDNGAYQELLTHFGSFIMPNRSRHAQFLLFHFSQSSTAYANDFVQQCLRRALDRTITSNTRLTACAYVASFTARGAHIPTEIVRDVFSLLCQYLEKMRQIYEVNCAGPDRKSYSIYYAVAQALLYIFCFRWRDLVVGSTTPDIDGDHYDEEDILADGYDLIWLPGMKDTLNVNINSVLNPLKVCSRAIVSEFAKIANHLRFLYVFSLLERNKRVRLGQVVAYNRPNSLDIGQRGSALDKKSGDSHHQLAPYFPFDPYHLPQSKTWLEGDYNQWKLPRGLRQDEDDDASSSEDDYESGEDSIPDDVTGQAVAATAAIAISG